MTVALMYHGIYRDEEDLLGRIDAEDRPYAVKESVFEAQLQQLAKMRCGLIDSVQADSELTAPPEIVITFDDGHASNFDLALPLLLKYDLTAYFFVTTDFIGKRKHFCDWSALAEMQRAGMIIGSHGITHRFFEDLEECDARHEFSQSRQIIEAELEDIVFSISFPGGRYSVENMEQARQCGYSQIFGSGFGTIKHPLQKTTVQALNRIAIRESTTEQQFRDIVQGEWRYYAKQQMTHAAKSALKRIIGNDRYHALYKYAAERR